VARGWSLLAQDAQKRGDSATERQAYDRVLQLQPEDVSALLGRARMRFASGDAAGALVDSRAAVRAAPSYAPAHYNLAVALVASGDPGGGKRELREALRLDPGFEPARQALQKLP
jgi:tetratricopeptide (TPR) repeat protein